MRAFTKMQLTDISLQDLFDLEIRSAHFYIF